ncbi:hypothetical protein OG946_24555 [Streptomyces sp. NBC_01808]|uniref:hypothetical protein n=1 Tax=Streptomyces sp. NBC_01808 TaxID=2975947 RepID=UPI002DDA131E|nr:hypothetical protein [Streptomyces sp. NBC_01808]WSA40257.1 hypothetical protein OG946_24555 [Streptomyces sp. NBC_01808]
MPDRIKKHERGDDQRIRVNPLLISLDDIPLDWILKGREGAVWQYSAVFRPDGPEKPETARWQIMLGSEEPLTIIPEESAAAHASRQPTGGAQTTGAPGQSASASAPAPAASRTRPAAHTREESKRRR